MGVNMFNWLENLILKRVIKRIKKQIPELKTTALEYLEDNKDELLDKCKEKLKETIKNFVASKINR